MASGCIKFLLAMMIGLLPLQAAAQSVVRVGVFENPPIVLSESPGRYGGLSVEVLEHVAAEEDWRLEYVSAPWKQLLSRLATGDIDLLVGIAHTEERARRFDYTSQTLINNWGMVYRNPGARVDSLSALQGQRVALMTDSIHSKVFRNLMLDFGFAFTPVQMPDYDAVLAAVAAGQADAGVVNRMYSVLNAKRYQVRRTGILFNPVEVRYAAPKGANPALLRTLDRHITIVKGILNHIFTGLKGYGPVENTTCTTVHKGYDVGFVFLRSTKVWSSSISTTSTFAGWGAGGSCAA